MKTWLKILIILIAVSVVVGIFQYFINANQNKIFSVNVDSLPLITLEKVDFKIPLQEKERSSSLYSMWEDSNINYGKKYKDYLSFDTPQGNFLIKRIYINNISEINKLVDGKIVHILDVPRGGSKNDLISSNNKGEVYAVLGGNIYKIMGTSVLPILENNLNNKDTEKLSENSAYAEYVQYANGNWYADAQILYVIQNDHLLPVEGIKKFGHLQIITTQGSTLVYITRIVPGFCGDADCYNSDIYSLNGGKAEPILLNGQVERIYTDKRGYVYIPNGAEILILKDNKIIGKSNMRIPSMYSDENNTYIYTFNTNGAGSAINVYKINLP